MAVTPNMNLNLPSVTTTPGPTWATLINAALGTGGIDSHDHTDGKGVQIPSAGLDIDAALTFNSFDATDLRTTRYTSQTNTLAETTDLSCVYSVGGDLYWNNGSGTAVRITDGSTLSATSLGGITGLPNTGAFPNASVSFDGSVGDYNFENATNTPAPIDCGPVTLREVATSPLGVTLASPASLAGAYTLTMLAALPATTSFLTVSSSGQLASGPAESLGIGTANLAAGAVTRAKLAAVGQQVSSAGGLTTSSTSLVDVTDATVTITTTGRPVIIATTGDTASQPEGFTVNGASLLTAAVAVSGSATGVVLRDRFAGASGTKWPASSLWTLYAAAAGTYTFTLQIASSNGVSSVGCSGVKLVAYEL